MSNKFNQFAALRQMLHAHDSTGGRLAGVRDAIQNLESGAKECTMANPLGQEIHPFVRVGEFAIEVETDDVLPILRRHEAELARAFDDMKTVLKSAERSTLL